MSPRRSTSYHDDKEALLKRLRRMEGQVRNLQQMVGNHRYCLDVFQQINALTAAARAVALIVLEDRLRGCVVDAVNEEDANPAITEMMTVLGRAMGR